MPALAETFGTVANVRIRNAATVGGVLAEADYASDPPAAFLALDATVEVPWARAAHATIPIAEFFPRLLRDGARRERDRHWHPCAAATCRDRAVYEKFVTRSSEDRPCVGVFAALRLAAGRADVCRPARRGRRRGRDTPALSRGRSPGARPELTDAVVRAVADAYAERIDTLADMRGSAWYRTEMVRVWVRRAIEHARARARRGMIGMLDARGRVTGRVDYTINHELPGMLHARVLRSILPHARIGRIDASRARAAAGRAPC